MYKGTLVQQGIANETDWFKVQYEDGDTEWLCLSTLETDGTLGLQGPAERRVKWCLCEHTKVTNGLSQATGAPTKQPMADDGKVSELQAEVAQAQSEIDAANKRPTRAAKARAQDALGGAAQAAADLAAKPNRLNKEQGTKNKQVRATATPATRQQRPANTGSAKPAAGVASSTRGGKRTGGKVNKPIPKRKQK